MADDEIQAEWPRLAAARDLIAQTHADLVGDQDRLRASVNGLLDGRWRGVAASSYRDGWDEWTSSADVVLQSLATMGHLVDGVLTGFQATDGGVSGNVGRVQQRLGPS